MSDPINHAIIRQVMTHLRSGNIRRCLELGFRHEELNVLSQMSVESTAHLLNMTVPFITISIDHEMLARSFERVMAENERQTLIQRAINHGASIHMMMTYFGVSSEEVSARRRIMGLNVKAGRIPQPGEQDSARAWHRWKSLTENAGIDPGDFDSLAGLDLMILLAEETRLSLAAIWDLLKAWYPQGAVRKRRKSAKSSAHE